MKIRPAGREDFAAVAELFGAADEAASGRPSRIDADAVDGWLQTIAFGTNTWLFEEDAQLVAAGFAQLHGTRGTAAGVVHPSARGRGLGTRLVELAEARMTEEGAARVHAWTVAGDSAADDLLRRRGYREVRRFWEMTIELGADPPRAPRLPEGFLIEPFSSELARAFHAALEEAFAGHWEYQPASFEQWWERQVAKPDHDPTLWFLVRTREGVVAATRNDPERSGGGWIGALGVCPAWRGRGLAKALLLHSFREFHRRGERRVGLGVDSENATGATKLYESVGMSIDTEQVVWEKVLA